MKKLISLTLAVMMIIAVISLEAITVFANTNNSFANAKKISVNTSYTDNLATSSEVDYFKFSLSGNAKIVVNFTHTYIESGSTYWVVKMYDSNYQELSFEFNVKGNKINSNSVSIGLPSGTYYLRIGNNRYDSRNYTFSVNSTTSDYWEKEINNDFYSASTMSTNAEYHGSIGTSDDKDYYCFSLSSNSKTSITFKHDHIDSSSTYWDIRLYDSSFEQIMRLSVAGNTTSVTGSNIGLPSGKYYIKIINGYHYSEIDYSIKVNSSSVSNWETELNNDYNSGDSIPFNSALYGSLCDSDDVDYYKFSLSKTENIAIRFEHNYIDSSRTYWRINLYDANGGTNKLSISSAGNKTLTTSSQESLPAGDYYIKITNYYDYSGIDYWLTVSGPNIDTAKPTASISSTNNAASSQTVTLKMSDNVGLAGYYWGTSSSTSPSFTSISGTSKTVTQTVSTNGTYYLTVKDKSGNVYQTSKTFYKTTLNANGGSVSPSSVISESGSSFDFPTPTRAGDYAYLGWSKSSSGMSGIYSLKPTENATYYALWKSLTLSSISISSMPMITVYETGEAFDPSGLKIKLSYKEGYTKVINGTDASISGFKSNVPGDVTVKVSYGGKSTTFKVTIINPTATVLQMGSVGNEVKAVQQRLYKLEYLTAAPDGNYGAKTRDAVIAFQVFNGLESPDGKVGNWTRNVLRNSPAAFKVLKRGIALSSAEKNAVMIVQKRLVNLNYLHSTPDGSYGNFTYQAVLKFQKVNGLPADGTVGRLTLAKLYTDPVKYTIKLSRTLCYGNSGNDVREVQEALAAYGFLTSAPDGQYGPMTEAAIKLFQAYNGLASPDGKVGNWTLTKLNSKAYSFIKITNGYKGNSVKVTQTYLKRLGYLNATPDGTYGAKSAEAVRKFQLANGLSTAYGLDLNTMLKIFSRYNVAAK